MNKIFTVILTAILLSTGSAQAFFGDMGTYQQNYDVKSDTSILLLEAGTNYKLKFKGLSGNVDETTISKKDLPDSIVEIKYDEHKTMGSSTIHVVKVHKTAQSETGFIHLITYNGDGGDRQKHKEYFARTVIMAQNNCPYKRDKVCGIVDFADGERYKIEFRNRCELDSAGAAFSNEGSCS